MKNDTLTDLYAVLAVGGRNSGEKSRALEGRYYRDPAETVEFPGEIARREKARQLKSRAKLKFKGNQKGK